MLDALATVLARCNPRERWLLALGGLVAVPAVLVLGVTQPLTERRAGAHAAAVEARALHGWVMARQAELRALPQPAPPPDSGTGRTADGDPPGLAGIEARLVAAGLRGALIDLTRTADGDIALRLADAPFAAVMPLLESLADGGYRIASLQLLRGTDPGTVATDAVLEPVS